MDELTRLPSDNSNNNNKYPHCIQHQAIATKLIHADTMDVSSLEAVAVLAISPAIASPSATDTSNSSDGDHRDQGRDETTTSVATIPAS